MKKQLVKSKEYNFILQQAIWEFENMKNVKSFGAAERKAWRALQKLAKALEILKEDNK